MKSTLKKCFLLLLAIGLLIPIDTARADGAPPPDFTSLGGAGPFKYQETKVQMVYERVNMELQVIPDPNDSNRLVNRILVDAWFFMHNQGEIEEQMQVIFPLGNFYDCTPPAESGYFQKSELSYSIDADTFIVSVDGIPVPTKKVTTENPHKTDDVYCNQETMDWAGFDVTFPINRDVLIRVSYNMISGQYESIESVQYVLETGAGWNGPIGRADITFQFPYEVTPDNIIGPEHYLLGTTTGYQVLYNQLAWSFINLEPTSDDNLFIKFVLPEEWNEVQRLRGAVEENPQDVDSWLSLIDLYRVIAWECNWRSGSNTIYQYCKKIAPAYEQAINANPNNAELYARYALFLLEQIPPPINSPNLFPPSEAIINNLNRALALDPYNETAHYVLSELGYIFPDFTYTPPATIAPTATSLIPTSTKTPTITLTPTDTPAITLTPTYTLTWTRTPAPSPTPTPISTVSPVPYFTVKMSDHYLGTGWVWLFFAFLLIGAGVLVWRLVAKKKYP